MAEDNKNKSPCIKQCRLDENNVCVGCGRTIDEIIESYDKKRIDAGKVERSVAL